MDIPLHSQVRCGETPCGRLLCLIIQPGRRILTDIVVEREEFHEETRLVPRRYIDTITSETIQLSCSLDEWKKLEPFIAHEYVMIDLPNWGIDEWSSVYPQERGIDVPREEVPAGELPLHRDAHVSTSDGRVGHLHTVQIDPETGRILGLEAQFGHFWNRERYSATADEIDHIDDDTVFLTVTRHDLS